MNQYLLENLKGLHICKDIKFKLFYGLTFFPRFENTSTDSCYLASDSAPLVVCDLPEKLLRMGLLLLILPALSL